MKLVNLPEGVIEASNWVSGRLQGGASSAAVVSPYTGGTIGKVHHSKLAEVDAAVRAAHQAWLGWAETPVKDRAAVLFKFREILLRDLDLISHRAAAECGKLPAEAKAGVMKGIEVLEFATALQNSDPGTRMQVSSGVWCETRREPLGVVAGITPFNFPAMVPMWMIPIALAVGNAFVWKPSDKTPLTSLLIAAALKEAGLPDGVLTLVQGGKESVEALCDHPLVQAVGFVGSTPVAKAVYQRATSHGKRALCLGGAKNHIILMPDADPEIAAQGILSSYTGCAGQRCMAASVVLAVGDCASVIDQVKERSRAVQLGTEMGALISQDSLARLKKAIDRAQEEGAEISVDGRAQKAPAGYEGGNWLGATVLDHVRPGTQAATEELFGPVLAVTRVKTLQEALAIENSNPYGNAASVFTTQGAVAEEVALRARAGMIGVNIGVPVPREPFSFGGWYDSKFGTGDITGDGGVAFWSNQKKVTTKWTLPKKANWMS